MLIGGSKLLSSDEEMVRVAVHLNWRSGNLGYRFSLVTMQICDSDKPYIYISHPRSSECTMAYLRPGLLYIDCVYICILAYWV